MSYFYLDASAWVKRHVREEGTEWLNRFWAQALPTACSTLGLIETLAAVARRHAAEDSSAVVTRAALAAVDRDFEGFCQIGLGTEVLAIACTLPERYRLRGADCVHLASALLLQEVVGQLVTISACDTELLKAAQATGISALDPLLDPVIPTK